VEEVKPKAMEALRGGWGMPGIFWCFWSSENGEMISFVRMLMDDVN
jgi:hypothetical protein